MSGEELPESTRLAIAQVAQIERNIKTYMEHTAPQLLAAQEELMKGARQLAAEFEKVGLR